MEFTVVLLVDEDGNQECGDSIEQAQDKWDENIGGAWCRRVDVVLDIDPSPSVVRVEVPAPVATAKIG